MIDNSSDGTSVVNMLVCRLNKKKKNQVLWEDHKAKWS
jgi:hypothetical protein